MSIQFLPILANTWGYLSFNFNHPSGCDVIPCCGFDLQFPAGGWCLLSFPVPVGHSYVCSIPLHNLNTELSFYWVVSIFIYSDYRSFVTYRVCKYFLLFCGWSFHFLYGALWSTKVLILVKSTLSGFFLLLFVLLTWYRRDCFRIQGHESLLLFSSKSFMSLALTFRFAIPLSYFWFIISQGQKHFNSSLFGILLCIIVAFTLGWDTSLKKFIFSSMK